MKNVLIMIPSFHVGGVPNLFKNLITFKNFNWFVAAKLSRNNIYFDHYSKYCTRVQDIDMLSFKFSSLVKLIKFIRSSKPTVAIAAGKSGLVYSLFLNTKTIIGLHGYKPKGIIDFSLLLSHKFKKTNFIAISKDEVKILKKYNLKYSYIPNGFKSSEIIKKNNYKAKERFTWIGRITPVKNLELVLKLDDFFFVNGIKVDVYGGYLEREQEYALNLIYDINNSKSIKYLGESSDLLGAINCYDCLIFTSLSEGLPTVIIESMIAGLPTISTPCSGSVELLEQNRGILSEGFSKYHFIKAVEYFLSLSTENVKYLTDSAKDFSQTKFNYDKFLNSYIKLINNNQ